MLTAEQKETIETLFLGKVLAKEEDLIFFKSHFKYVGPLGKGAFAVVVAARWTYQGQERLVAVKCFCKEEFESNTIEQFRKEAKITHGQENDYLLSNLAVLETPRRLFLVFPLMRGGTLAQYMLHRFSSGGSISEKEVSIILHRIILAVKFIQENKIVHRDLKPENILLERVEDITSLRISDFGLAIRAGMDRVMSLYVKCGTPAYMAPEMYTDGMYSRSVDMWSTGVIMYRLLSKGAYPFMPEELKKLAKDPEQSIEEKFANLNYSRNCMHILRALLQPDVIKRCPYYIAAEHPFLTQEDREPALMLYELENAQELTTKLRQVFGFLIVASNLRGQADCVFYKSVPPVSNKLPMKVTTPGKNTKPQPKDFRIQNSNHKRSPTSNFLELPTSKTRVTLSDKHSKEADESDGSLPHSKNGSVRPTSRSDRALVVAEEKTKVEKKAKSKNYRSRIASSGQNSETYTLKDLTPTAANGSKTSLSKADLMRKSASCAKGFNSVELPPLPIKAGNFQAKLSKHRFTPTSKADTFRTFN